jgi:outer membrane protein OmpA-like peptidoglycan-associated protein
LNFSAVINAAVQRSRNDGNWFKARRIFGSNLFASIMVLLLLVACTAQHPRPPLRKPPPRSPDSVVAPAAGIAVLNPGSYEQDKARIKAMLANNDGDSLASTEVGYYLDVLQGRLKQVAGQSLGVARRGDRIVLTWSIRDGFEPAGSKISPGMREALKPLSKALVEYRKTFVSIQIRPEDAGTPTSNARLAEQRASAVAHGLAENGVAGKRIVIVGSGARTDQAAAVKAGPESPVRIELQIEPLVHASDGKH